MVTPIGKALTFLSLTFQDEPEPCFLWPVPAEKWSCLCYLT